MPLSQLRNVNFGRARANATGSNGVGYTVLDQTGATVTSRTTSSIYQTAPGIYAAYIMFPDDFRGQVLWDTGTAFLTASYATEQYNVEENDPRVASIYTQTTYVSSTVATISSSVSGLSSSISQVDYNVLSTLSMLTVVSGNVDNVYNEVISLSSSLATVSTDLSASVVAISDAALIVSSSAAIIDNSVTLLSGAISDLTAISGSIANIQTDVTYIKSRTDALYDTQYGRWKIVNNQMIFYKEDNATEVARFDLFDDAGNPSEDAVFERVRV